jgi:hypothetical protein
LEKKFTSPVPFFLSALFSRAPPFTLNSGVFPFTVFATDRNVGPDPSNESTVAVTVQLKAQYTCGSFVPTIELSFAGSLTGCTPLTTPPDITKSEQMQSRGIVSNFASTMAFSRRHTHVSSTRKSFAATPTSSDNDVGTAPNMRFLRKSTSVNDVKVPI